MSEEKLTKPNFSVGLNLNVGIKQNIYRKTLFILYNLFYLIRDEAKKSGFICE